MAPHDAAAHRDEPRRLPWVFALAVGVLVAVPLLLSDRAPDLIRNSLIEWQLTDEARRLAFGYDPYLVAHAAMWGALAFAAAMAMRRVVPAWIVASGVFVASVGSELLQRSATRSRTFETADIEANTFGIIVGTMLAVAVIQAVRLLRRARSVG